MSLNRFAVATLVLFLGGTTPGVARAVGMPQGSPQYGYGQDRGGWDTPPQELQDIQRQGFRDGIIGAQKDLGNHRRPDPNNRDEYRRPNLPRAEWDAYRDGFRRGYARGVAHLTGQDQQAPMYQPDRSGAIVGPGPGNDVRLRGFQDGMEGALRDLGNHRRPDPNNRDEYRHPDVPYGMQDAYRDGFRDGYQQGMDALTRGPGSDDRYRGRGSEVRRRGFQDGAEGALKDFGNHRQPDPNNRDEYRHPDNVPYGMQDAYRDGFRRGYERVMSQLMGYSNRR
jgi:hypothetical protein